MGRPHPRLETFLGYCRHENRIRCPIPEPYLIIGSHELGAVVDLRVIAMSRLWEISPTGDSSTSSTRSPAPRRRLTFGCKPALMKPFRDRDPAVRSR
jgi:hypothetical protein